MFEAAGIDALTGLALLYAAALVGLTTALVHMVWQVSLRTSRFEWRGAVVSSAIIIAVLGAALFVSGSIRSWASVELIFVLATASLLGGALFGRFVGWVGRAIVNKSSPRSYR
jgi:hypothetical protein